MIILYQQSGLVAINKPPGMSVHDAPGIGRSVLRELAEVHGLKELTPVHRLDRDASGVLLFAETKAIAAEIQNVWSEVEKEYIAICEGRPKERSGLIDAPILENQTGKPERLRNALKYYEKTHPGERIPPIPIPKMSAVHPAGRTSQTRYEVIAGSERCSVLRVSPRQGRMHQIRVHLARIGHALVVDPLYGRKEAFEFGGEAIARLPLHAAKLTVPFRGARLTFEAGLAEDMDAIIKSIAATAS